MRHGAEIEKALAERGTAGGWRIGQIALRGTVPGPFALCHREDLARGDLALSRCTEDAAEIAKYDDSGNYRPLKTAPNLRRGWQLMVADAAELQRALDQFYPGRLAAFSAWLEGALIATPLRETLARQSGIYRVASKITKEQADTLAGNFCRSDGGCLRAILWKYDLGGAPASTRLPPEKFAPDHDQTGRGERVIPLICQEACGLVVGEARKIVKGESEYSTQ